MNLNNNPNFGELQAILRALDDDGGPHIVWVGFDGEVHIDPLPKGLLLVGYHETIRKQSKFRLETLDRGNEYVGQKAAGDKNWVERLLGGLNRLWRDNATGYCDSF